MHAILNSSYTSQCIPVWWTSAILGPQVSARLHGYKDKQKGTNRLIYQLPLSSLACPCSSTECISCVSVWDQLRLCVRSDCVSAWDQTVYVYEIWLAGWCLYLQTETTTDAISVSRDALECLSVATIQRNKAICKLNFMCMPYISWRYISARLIWFPYMRLIIFLFQNSGYYGNVVKPN
jgi:hypothetical protein